MNFFLNSSHKLRTGFRALGFYFFSIVVLVVVQTVVRLFGLNDGRNYQAVVYAFEAVGILGVSALSLRWMEHLNTFPLGLRRRKAGLFLAVGLMGGAVSIGMVFLAIWLQSPTIGALSFHPDILGSLAFFLGLAVFFSAAAVEEMLFRGYPFLVLRQSLGRWGAAVFLSLLFVAVHPNFYHSAAALVSIFLGGVFFTQLFVRVESLWLPIGFHFGWNLAQDLIFPLPGQSATVISAAKFNPTVLGLTIGVEQSWWAALVLFLLVVAFEVFHPRSAELRL